MMRLALAMLLAASLPALAANTPCSGKKGGVSHCAGARFVCNDGSISASKKMCSAGGAAPARQARPAAAAGGDCSCRSGNLCTGPRGGRYCVTDSGRKSYARD